MPVVRRASKPWKCDGCESWIGYRDYYLHDNYRHVCISCAMKDDSKLLWSADGVQQWVE
jgi:hypothetical protein